MTQPAFKHLVIRASAGSGKTHQLTSRYIDLLARDHSPDTILATTFTRKAAGEILERVLSRLAQAADESRAVSPLSYQSTGERSTLSPNFSALLRSLLQNLHRARISTLDSFAISLAESFSLELGLPAGWSIGEEADEQALRREALERLLEGQPEFIGMLFPLLSKGEAKRSIQGALQEAIDTHYEIFRGSKRAAWECLDVPPAIDLAQRTRALEDLRNFTFFAGRDPRFAKARDKDLGTFLREDWAAFIKNGLALRALTGEPYYKKPIPPEAQDLYQVLLQHARHAILDKLAKQTRATWLLLECFHAELAKLKQATGQLRFDDVTQALGEALGRQSLSAHSLAFRLDGAIEHLLLDEFQDTSLGQWRLLEPLARRITETAAEGARSFFCVGDVKQAIYGWRGGLARIFDTLPHSLGKLDELSLNQSRRSAQPIIDTVNHLFSKLSHCEAGDKHLPGIAAWSKRFVPHSTAKTELVGYACLHTGPAQTAEENTLAQRGRHCQYVAQKVRALVQEVPGASVGVLCRKNDTVARMIYELRQLEIDASEEGGIALTDSPAVAVMLSLFTLADHPEHSVAWFHLKNSPLKAHLQSAAESDALARELRRQLFTDGYGKFTYEWAKRLVGACGRRDLSRLQQLVEMAYQFQERSTLRADDFVHWVRHQRQLDPSAATVRVMTVHAAKGLEFDSVVLPELDTSLAGQSPAFVVRHNEKLQVEFVCRYVDHDLEQLLSADEQRAFKQDRQQRVEESLSLLYVALTRAVHALYLFIPGPRQNKESGRWYNLLQQTLAPDKPWAENALLYEHGDPAWARHFKKTAMTPPELDERKPITFSTVPTERRRGLEHIAPSRREGKAMVVLDRLFQPSEGTGLAAGTLYHAWFESIEWLDDGVPTENDLRAIAQRMRADLPPETWRDLDRLLANFRAWLEKPALRAILSRSAYADRKSLQVERERPFLVREGTKFWNGTLDRIVWLGDGKQTAAADVIDYKTDDLPPGDEQALADRTEHYRPQLEAYRGAVARLAKLPAERITTRLVFAAVGRVVEV